MSDSYHDLVEADRRLAILQALARPGDYTANDLVLGELIAAQGHRVSRDRLRADLAWLEEQGLLIAQRAGVWVCTLSVRGYDAAQGLAEVPGVARPRPE